MKNTSLRVVTNKNVECEVPTFEESVKYQAKLIGSWEQQLEVLGYTVGTRELYVRNINEFLDISKKFIWEVTTYDADNFYASLLEKGNAYNTRRKYQSNIVVFLDYIRTRFGNEIWDMYGVPVPTVIDKFNRHHHRKDDADAEVTPPSQELLNKFWDGLKEEMKNARKYSTIARDYTLYRTLELAGLRIFEAVQLDVKDCRFDLGEKGKIHVRFGKGARGTGYKKRYVPMLNDLDRLLKWYIDDVRPLFTDVKSGPLFMSEAGKRLNRDTARNGLRRRQQDLGFLEDEIFSPHQLRHAFATRNTELGVDLLTLKTLLGHKDIATTFIYTNPGSDFLEKKIRMSQEKWRKQLESER